MKKNLLFLSMAISAILMTGCATSKDIPSAQLAASQTALDDAQRAGAREFAPVATRAAEDKLQRARAAVADKDYNKARQLAEEAEADAHVAQASAIAAKSQKAASEIQQSNQLLRQGSPQ